MNNFTIISKKDIFRSRKGLHGNKFSFKLFIFLLFIITMITLIILIINNTNNSLSSSTIKAKRRISSDDDSESSEEIEDEYRTYGLIDIISFIISLIYIGIVFLIFRK